MKSTFKKQMFVQAKNFENGSQRLSKNASSSSFIDPSTYMVNGEFVFRIPPEAPVFEPTVEEFLDPLAYIRKIRPIAEKTGICKIKPPSEWHPPFAVDVDRFKFTPRVQKLNELDANTRVRLYFLDRLATYWNYSGVQIRIPAIDDKTIDMYSLYKIVELEGGFDKVNLDKRWTTVAARMGYVNEKAIASTLRLHYKRLLLPFEKFEKTKIKEAAAANVKEEEYSLEGGGGEERGVVLEKKKKCSLEEGVKVEIKSKEEEEVTSMTSNSSSAKAASNFSLSDNIKRCTRSTSNENDTEILVSETFKNPIMQDKNKELQRLTFYGPGPKILGSSRCKQQMKEKKEIKKSEITDYFCLVCGNGESEESILLCDGCDDGYHTFCLIPPLSSIPKGEWRCPQCIAAVINKPNDAFGFEQAEKEYTLQQFGEMADQFKSNYFNMPVHLVPTEKVEQEYWRILSSMDSNVTVEYGADLHSMDHGSGFPTHLALKEPEGSTHYYKSYVESSWNLNNIPVLEGSVLGYINADISGMKIPWMYVGMCFSTFCWHNEDHWSYSINYLHWGEPKTWYGVPGSKAEDFERVMQETTPDLFQSQPDLLHQLVTILNPNILMDKGVPVYHIDQAAGEFVLTFPRAYHAGFNHGYNFAEAVNFAPVDWIPLGRLCVDHYSNLHRFCVFSHDELICKMASLPDNLNSKLAGAAYEDMVKMLEVENKQRKALLEWGVVNAEREAFELLADDERQCSQCNTTCFLSAVTCKCSPKKVTCLRHFSTLCSCPPIEHTLRYRYTLDELPVMLDKLKEKADSVSIWALKVHDALDITTARTITLPGLKELLHEAREKNFPNDPSLDLLSKAIFSVQDALTVNFRNILAQKPTLDKKVTVTEIKSYYDELLRIPCVLPQENTVFHFLNFLEEFKKTVNATLRHKSVSVEDIEKLINQVNFPNVEIVEIEMLRRYKDILQWMAESQNTRNGMAADKKSLTLETINHLLGASRDILHFPKVMDMVKRVTNIRDDIQLWEKQCKRYLDGFSAKPHLSELEKLLKQADEIEGFVPSRAKVCQLMKRTVMWKQRVQSLSSYKNIPFLQVIEDILDDGQNSLVLLEELPQLQSIVNQASKWKETVENLFLINGQNSSLLDILTPRKNIRRGRCIDKDEEEEDIESIFADINIKDDVDTAEIVSALIIAEKSELEMMLTLRVKNIYQRTRADGKFCICNKIISQGMNECALCKNLFHNHCIEENVLQHYYNNNRLTNCNLQGGKFLCPFCQRTNRPNLKSISLQISKLLHIPVRIMEGEALRRLVVRATEWQTEANKLLSSNEMVNAICKITKLEECSKLTNNSQISSSGRAANNIIILGTDVRENLESLLVRGDLIELNLPEIGIIWKLLKYAKFEVDYNLYTSIENYSVPPIEVQNDENSSAEKTTDKGSDSQQTELNSETLSSKTTELPNNIVVVPKERKRKSSVAVKDDGEADKIQIIYDGAIENKLLKRCNNSSSNGNGNCSSSGTIKTRTTTRRRCVVQKLQQQQQRQKEVGPNQSSSSSNNNNNNGKQLSVDEEDEEDVGKCDAGTCLRPNGDHVDWVQCDYCKRWLHMICIGVTKNQVENQTKFKCRICNKSKFAATSSSPSAQQPQGTNLDNEDDGDIVFIDCSADF